MDLTRSLAVGVAGVLAGTVNTVVGSGTLISFPVLLALGLPAVPANVSSNIGLVFGSLSGTWGYRRELVGQGGLIRRFAPASLAGSVVGALILLRLPESAFEAVVPALIGLAVVLVLVQPRLARWTAARHPRGEAPSSRLLLLLVPVVALTGVYGGYFGAAQGVLLVGLLGATLPIDLQRVNAVKNLLAGLVNLVAAVTFVVVSPEQIELWAVVPLAVGAALGGVLGARIGRRLSPSVLRWVVVVIGVVALVRLATS